MSDSNKPYNIVTTWTKTQPRNPSVIEGKFDRKLEQDAFWVQARFEVVEDLLEILLTVLLNIINMVQNRFLKIVYVHYSNAFLFCIPVEVLDSQVDFVFLLIQSKVRKKGSAKVSVSNLAWL